MSTAPLQMPPEAEFSVPVQRNASVLYLAAAVAAFSAIAYELLLATYATFLLGASIVQYSIVFAVMMAAMGFGALIADRVRRRLLETFLSVEFALAWIAILAIPVLYLAFAKNFAPQVILLGCVIFIGVGIGMEIPLINRLQTCEEGLPRVLFFDYLGGFFGGIAFPLWLQPQLGFFRVAGCLALVNALVASVVLVVEREEIKERRIFWMMAALLTVVAATVFLLSGELLRHRMELELFQIRHNP